MTSIDGMNWNYDVTVYPKNERTAPTLEKTLRESKADTGKNDGTDSITDGYALLQRAHRYHIPTETKAFSAS